MQKITITLVSSPTQTAAIIGAISSDCPTYGIDAEFRCVASISDYLVMIAAAPSDCSIIDAALVNDTTWSRAARAHQNSAGSCLIVVDDAAACSAQPYMSWLNRGATEVVNRATPADIPRAIYRALSMRDQKTVTEQRAVARAPEERLLRDITFQNKREEQSRFQALLVNAVGEAIIATLPDGTITFWNKAAEQMYGWTATEATGQKLLGLIGTNTQNNYDAITEMLSSNGQWSGEFRDRRRDGSTFHVLSHCTPILEDGVLVGTIAAAVDITERKQLEQRLDILFRDAPVPIVLFDLKATFRDVNHAYEELIGHSREELVGRTSIEMGVVTPDVGITIVPIIRRIMAGETVQAFEMVVHASDGRTIEVEINMHMITIQDELLIMGSLRDNTARKQVETSLRESLRRQEELNDLKTRFITTASHEFRTPLATIMITADSLLAYRKKMDEAKIDYRLKKICAEVNHLKSLIEDVLHAARTQSGRLSFNPSAFDLDGLLIEIVDEFQGAPGETHTLRYTSAESPMIAFLDPMLMKQVITNLISNALKYSPHGTTVHIDLARADENLVLSVADHGIGIPASDLPHLFEQFHRASNVGAIAGTGLGLSITRECVEQHGGRISVESIHDQGTTFTVTIPVHARTAPQPTTP